MYDIEQEKCFDVSIQQCSLTQIIPNGPVLYPLTVSGGIKIEHWGVNGLTHVVLFYWRFTLTIVLLTINKMYVHSYVLDILVNTLVIELS